MVAAGTTFWEQEAAREAAKGGKTDAHQQQQEQQQQQQQGMSSGVPSGRAPRPLIVLDDEEEEGAGEGDALYHRRLEQAQRAHEARKAVPDLLTGVWWYPWVVCMFCMYFMCYILWYLCMPKCLHNTQGTRMLRRRRHRQPTGQCGTSCATHGRQQQGRCPSRRLC